MELSFILYIPHESVYEMVKKEDREQVLFNKISDAMLPVFVQYGRSIIREAMTLPETHLTIQRNYPKFTPAIEKYREVLLTDSRLIKCIRNLEQLDFFNKNKGKYLLLEHFIFQVTPINLMLLLLEYVLVNQEASWPNSEKQDRRENATRHHIHIHHAYVAFNSGLCNR